MSVSMFFIPPQPSGQESFNLPVCTEVIFRDVVRPAAERAGAQIVPLFEDGFELSRADAAVVLKELSDVVKQLEETPSEAAAYAVPRLIRLSGEIGRIFESFPEAVLYIG